MKNFLTETLGWLDLLAWLLVLAFFSGSALLFGGNLLSSLLGAGGIIVEMLLIAVAVEVIIECLKNRKGIGTLTGFITNGPEMVVLIVGLIIGDIIFAASTPLGSNFMNPLLLLLAALLCHRLGKTLKTRPSYFLATMFTTSALAGSFFLLEESTYYLWLAISIICTIFLFTIRPKETQEQPHELHSFNPNLWLAPAVILLTAAGYCLDPVVSYTAENSHTPKGVIGFFVLSTLTSWPEFKSCLALLKRDRHLSAILNIAVSNITNIWLAVAGIITYLSL